MSQEKDNLYVHKRLTELFSSHPILRDKKLKKLNIPYPANQYEHEKIEVVNWEEFIKNEPDRIPLLIANRAQLWPKDIPYEDFFEQKRTVALLHVAYLNLVILGCDVYELPAGFNSKSVFPSDYEAYQLSKR
jgi:hypothetical protein